MDRAAREEAIREAAERGDISALETLLRGPADLDAPDAAGETALYKAAARGFPTVVEMLLRAGADPNDAEGNSPALDCALDRGWGDVAEVLVEAGAESGEGAERLGLHATRCPLCRQTVRPGFREICAHWLCTVDDDEYVLRRAWTQDFAAAARELHEILGSLPFYERDVALITAPDEFKDWLEEAFNNEWFWTLWPELETVRYETSRRAGFVYYHADPRQFVEQFMAWLFRAVRWIAREVMHGKVAGYLPLEDLLDEVVFSDERSAMALEEGVPWEEEEE